MYILMYLQAAYYSTMKSINTKSVKQHMWLVPQPPCCANYTFIVCRCGWQCAYLQSSVLLRPFFFFIKINRMQTYPDLKSSVDRVGCTQAICIIRQTLVNLQLAGWEVIIIFFPVRFSRRGRRPAPLSGLRQSAVYVPLVGQVVKDTVVSQRGQFGVDRTLSLLPAALVPFFLRLLLFIFHLTLHVAAFIALHLWRSEHVQ